MFKFKIATVLFASMMFLISCDESTASNTAAKPESTEETTVVPKQTLHTEYFDVTVDRASVVDRVNTGNEFADLPEEEGNKYLLIYLTVTNTDKESRMMFDGEVEIKSGDQVFKYEQTELVAAEGWGLIVDNLNPGVTKRTKLVYKIPSTAKGQVFYLPGRGKGKVSCLTLY